MQAPDDAGQARYVGAAPPTGGPPHRYYLTVTAVDTAHLELPRSATPALLGLTISSHSVARGHLTATAAG